MYGGGGQRRNLPPVQTRDVIKKLPYRELFTLVFLFQKNEVETEVALWSNKASNTADVFGGNNGNHLGFVSVTVDDRLCEVSRVDDFTETFESCGFGIQVYTHGAV